MRIKLKSIAAALAVLLGLSGCSSQAEAVIDYQAEMVELLSGIRTYADSKRSGFQLIANGGSPLYLADNGNSAENAGRMLQIMDGQMAESVFYRWDTEQNCAVETDPDETAYFEYTLAVPRNAGLTVLSLDYVDSPEMEADSYKMNAEQGYLGWASYRRSLDEIPGAAPHGMNTGNIKSLKEARNYLVLLNPGRFKSRQDYLDKLAATYYDVLIVDLYYGTEPLTPEEVKALQHKPNGAQRQVFAYMSVGEAETYRPYWQGSWGVKMPDWLAAKNDDWADNYKVKYWRPEWRQILYGSQEAYLDRILSAGFDGAFLDVVDAYWYFLNPQDETE